MTRWLVQLSGDRTDLEEFPRWFPNGDIFAVEENGIFYLTGQALEDLPNAEAVRQAAGRALDQFTGVISLLWPALQKPKLCGVIRQTDDGRQDVYPSTSGVSLRAKGGAVVACSPPEPPRITQAETLLSRATGKPHLEQAISLWAGPRSWPRLYRILEEIERHIGMKVNEAGFCSDNKRDRFRRTADSAEAAGQDARHATGKFIPPAKPMTLDEGTEFVRLMLLRVLG